MAVLLVALALIVVAALGAIGHELSRLRRAVGELERRVAALELEHAPTLVIEPDRSDPPRTPNPLMN
ncbi:MAG TPA: hypothetical protein VGL86_09030 [Polyangia bacterium]